MGEKNIKLGVSSCLLGEKVRWDGNHKLDLYIKDVLGKYFELVPVCPEVEAGMGVPREPVALHGEPGNPPMLATASRYDWTRKMRRHAKKRIEELQGLGPSGYIFKNKSPSCGLRGVLIYSAIRPGKTKIGQGLFAGAIQKSFPLIPAVDETELRDPKSRGNFIERVLVFHRLQKDLLSKRASLAALLKFHAQNKFLLQTRGRTHYRALETIVASAKNAPRKNLRAIYAAAFMETLKAKASVKNNSDALLRLVDLLKKRLSRDEKRNLPAELLLGLEKAEKGCGKARKTGR